MNTETTPALSLDSIKELMDGFDPAYGARPLKRLIQHQIVDRAANEIVGGNLAEGDTIVIDLDGAMDFSCSVRKPLAQA